MRHTHAARVPDAAKDGALTYVNRLLAEGNDVDSRCEHEFNSTALMLACTKGHAAVVKVLLEFAAELGEVRPEASQRCG